MVKDLDVMKIAKHNVTKLNVKKAIKAAIGFPFYAYKAYNKNNILFDKFNELSFTLSSVEKNVKKISDEFDKSSFILEVKTCPNLTSPIIPCDKNTFQNLIKNKQLLSAEANCSNLMDKIVLTYHLNNKIYKAISSDYISMWTDLEKALPELLETNKIPNFSMTNFYTVDCPIIYEIECLTDSKPNTWSFEALKRAAICTLEVTEILNKYGFTLRDAHPWNVLFKGTSPKFIDFGSFFKNEIAEEWYDNVYYEFLNYFVFPLVLASRGEHLLAKTILFSSCVSYTTTLPCQNFFGSKLLKNLIQEIMSIPRSGIKDYISNLTFPDTDTLWKNYADFFQNEIKKNNLEFQGFHRYRYITEEIKKLTDCETILDIGGNSGAFLAYIKKECKHIKKGIVLDYDEYAINKALFYLQDFNNIEAYLINFMTFPPKETVPYKSDIVLALAFTHHLLLSQGFRIDSILKQINLVTNQYVFIEFMPWGLWDGGETKPTVPDWYTLEWFRENFRNYFEIVDEKDFDNHRYLFIGRIR